jgi:hypothetical protein
LRRIHKTVDANADGRLDADELKSLLQKHSNVFTDQDIVEISDLYYASKAGGSTRFDNFIEAVDQAAARSFSNEGVKFEDTASHFREGDRHPLGLGSCVAEWHGLGKKGMYTDEELDVKITHTEPKDQIDRAALAAVKGVRYLFDTATGWNNSTITTNKILYRAIFLETIAAGTSPIGRCQMD